MTDTTEAPRKVRNGTLQRTDGKWLAIRHGLPLMNPNNYANLVFPSKEAAEKALERESR